MADSLRRLTGEIMSCTRCPRLVEWRERSAAEPPRPYVGQRYWARPLPGFGDARARIAVVGLAAAAHGGNPPGRGVRSSGLPPPPTAATGRDGCSPGIAPATGSTPPCTAPVSPTSRPRLAL